MRRPAIAASYLRLGIVLAAISVVVVLALVLGESKPKSLPQADNVMSACGPYRKDGSVVINKQKIQVEIARNSAEFERGLGGHPCIEPDQGMFFAFNTPGQYKFWMKGMKFPIDVVWITASHKVAAIEIDFLPSSYPEQRANQIPAQYVLELKANRSKELHMAIGTPVSF